LTLSEVLRERLRAADVALTPDQLSRLVRYYELLAKWNRRLNLTSLTLDFPTSSVDRLIVEPLKAAQSLKRPGVWFDFGSGGGSPAIPMKVLMPSSRLGMVEARGRKASFLREVVRSLELSEASVFPIRIEDLPSEVNVSADLVTVRAVNLSGAVSETARRLLKPGGVVAAFATQRPEMPGFRSLDSQILLTPSTLFTFEKAAEA
jgi:16S rRNA (guanine527-N7)-methyltransferase